jgi:Ca2+-binding RTX toxin-like protein
MAVLFGKNGPTNLIGTGTEDTIFGAGGNDTLNGRGGNDHIFGDSENDSLIGGAGLDFMYGGEGNDTLNATGEGDDNLFGGFGDDVYVVSRISDKIVEGSNQGIDTVRSSTVHTLDANVENLILTEGPALNVRGIGNNLNNQITGNSGNNTLIGRGGNDTLTGGVGNDRFLFDRALPDAGVDTINDFVAGSEQILIDKSVFSALETSSGGALLATDFRLINVNNAAEPVIAATSSEEIIYNRVTGNLFYNTNGAAAGFGAGGGQFATIVGSPDNLSTGDFFIVP